MPITQNGTKTANGLIELIAGQMEIAAEFSHGYFCAANSSIFRYHELVPDPYCEELIRKGALQFIPGITSQDLYLWMIEFTAAIEDNAVRKQLQAALKGISATWKFNNALYHNQDLQTHWKSFKSKKLRDLAREWIESL